MGDQMTGSNEIVTMIGNIDALLNEIKQALGLNQGAGEEGATEATMNEEDQGNQQVAAKGKFRKGDAANEDKKDDEKIAEKCNKAVVETGSDGVTANDSADERQEEEATDTSEENMDKLAKALMTVMGGSVQKTKKVNPNARIEKALADIATVLKSMANEQNVLKSKQSETELALVNVLKGFGIADEVIKNVETPKKQVVQKGYTNSVDNERMTTFLKSLVGKEESNTNKFTAQARNEDVMKSLRSPEMLNYLIGSPKQ
jgi:hypothetical protein